MPENADTPKDLSQLTPAQARAELARREQAKMSRRDALARFGFKTAAAVAALTADDLLRAVGRDMQRRAGDSRITQEVANQLVNAGIVRAGDDRPPCFNCIARRSGITYYCGATYCAQRKQCVKDYYCRGDYSGFWSCLDDAKSQYSVCRNDGGTDFCLENPVDCNCNQDETDCS